MSRATAINVLVMTALVLGSPARGESTELADAFSKSSQGSAATVDHGAWSKLLATFVVPSRDGINRVRYDAFKSEGHQSLKSYIGMLQTVDVGSLNKAEQFAYWVNLYNAKTVDIVLDAYPVSSIRDISLGGGLLAAIKGGPWDAKVVTVSGRSLSLNDIEHGILRPVFHDPRIHYAVNCASIGCPNLMTQAFTGAKLGSMLDAAARRFINHPRGIAVADGVVTASSLYSWYGGDFASGTSAILDHIRRYAEPALIRKLEGITEIAAFDYDWSLNSAKP